MKLDKRSREIFAKHLEWSEDRRQFLYEDSVGLLSIGVGRNLEENGLRECEIDFMLKNDMDDAIGEASTLPYWSKLNSSRKIVVADMVFNMGLPRFRGFVRTNRALAAHDYEWAADEMVDSKWFRQTGRRAKRLVKVMRAGAWK